MLMSSNGVLWEGLGYRRKALRENGISETAMMEEGRAEGNERKKTVGGMEEMHQQEHLRER